MADNAGVADFAKFIIERERIRVKKDKMCCKPPWTTDPILAKYRFCNVRREDDAVTKWLRTNWYPAFTPNPDYWFTAIVARLLNQPESLEVARAFTLPFDPEGFVRSLKLHKQAGGKVFNAAYIVSTNGIAMGKIEYIAYNVLNVIWAERENMRPKTGDTLEVYHRMLMSFDGLGSFIAAQVVADLKYIKRSPLNKASDWHTFAASGPGSRRGLNRWRGHTPESPYPEDDWRQDLEYVREETNKLLTKNKLFPEPLTAQDIQNCLCEWDKYERARLGEGKPKQLYKEKNNG